MAVKLRYERPTRRLWPDILLLFPTVMFGGYYLSIFIADGLDAVAGQRFGRTVDSVVAKWPLWPATEMALAYAGVGAFFSLALFALFHGIRERRTLTIVLAVFLVLSLAIPFVMAFGHY